MSCTQKYISKRKNVSSQAYTVTSKSVTVGSRRHEEPQTEYLDRRFNYYTDYRRTDGGMCRFCGAVYGQLTQLRQSPRSDGLQAVTVFPVIYTRNYVFSGLVCVNKRFVIESCTRTVLLFWLFICRGSVPFPLDVSLHPGHPYPGIPPRHFPSRITVQNISPPQQKSNKGF